MANHAKRRPVPKGIWIGSAVTAAVAILVTVGILLVNNGVLGRVHRSVFPLPFVAGGQQHPAARGKRRVGGARNRSPIVFHRPDKLSGVRLTPGVDYLTGGKETADAVKAQLDAAMTAAKDWGFNTLLLPVTYKDKALFETEALETYRLTGTDGAAFDPVAYLLAAAGRRTCMYTACSICGWARAGIPRWMPMRRCRALSRPTRQRRMRWTGGCWKTTAIRSRFRETGRRLLLKGTAHHAAVHDRRSRRRLPKRRPPAAANQATRTWAAGQCGVVASVGGGPRLQNRRRL